jgi:hypothetical protein
MEVERSGAVRRALNCVDQLQLLRVQEMKRRRRLSGSDGGAETTWHWETGALGIKKVCKSASQLAHGDARAVSVVSEAAAGQSACASAGWYDCLPPRRSADMSVADRCRCVCHRWRRWEAAKQCRTLEHHERRRGVECPGSRQPAVKELVAAGLAPKRGPIGKAVGPARRGCLCAECQVRLQVQSYPWTSAHTSRGG